ncbi:MAG: 30S ribosome-binding factor RbfA [Calditrichales bacterium]|nr:30S ribosome-binding factor RbfA [Calditrichales bacterium]
MADSRRLNRYADMLKRALGNIIEFKMQDPNKGFVTLTRVKVSVDLKIATIYYTVLGDENQKDLTKKALKRSVPFIKNELKPYITTRWIPELRFFYDDTLEQAERINELLKKIKDDSPSEEK